jgi:hypothetical protein
MQQESDDYSGFRRFVAVADSKSPQGRNFLPCSQTGKARRPGRDPSGSSVRFRESDALTEFSLTGLTSAVKQQANKEEIMKKLETAIATLGMVLLAAPAFAVDTTKVYNSGILVLVFLGICALFVVSQMIPAIILLCGMIKGLVKNMFKGKVAVAAQESGKK